MNWNRSSPRLASALVAAALVVLPSGVRAASPGDLRPEDMVSAPILASLRSNSEEISPGTFHTLVFDVENPGWEARQVRLAIEPPVGWTAVSTVREFRLDRLSSEVTTFTLLVPADATADQTHDLEVLVTSSGDVNPVTRSHALRVVAQPRCEILAITPPLDGRGGQRARHVLRVTNAGNVRDRFALTVQGTPEWKVAVTPWVLDLAPGERQDVEIAVSVPRDVRRETLHVLELSARSRQESDTIVAHASVSTIVRGDGASASGSVRRLPARFTWGLQSETGHGTSYFGKMQSDGPLSADVSLSLDADFVAAEAGDGSRVLEGRRALATLEGPRWQLGLGDVRWAYPELVVGVTTRRGWAVAHDSEWGEVTMGQGVERGTDRAGIAGSWSRGISPGLHLKGVYLDRMGHHESEARRERLGAVVSRMTAGPRTEVIAEGAWSRRDGVSPGDGGAGQLRVDVRGEHALFKGRLYGGTSRFVGRYGARKSLNTHASYRPSSVADFWANLDMSHESHREDGGGRFSGRGVMGVRLVEPALEVEVRQYVDQAGVFGEDRDLRRSEVRLGTWHNWYDWVLSLNGVVGRDRDRVEGATPEGGRRLGSGVRASGEAGGIRTALSIDRTWEREPGSRAEKRETRWTSSHDWSSPERTWIVGLATHWMQNASTTAGTPWKSLEFRPRAEWRVRQDLSVRLEAMASYDRGVFSGDRIELLMNWSGGEIVPVPWFEDGPALVGRVFLDENLDGRWNSSEPGLPGVQFRIDGRRREVSSDGKVEFPDEIGGSYHVELETASVPTGLVPSRTFPREISVPGDGRGEITIPFVRAGSVSGSLFRDDSGDGRLTAGEPSLAGVRVELLRGGERVVSGLTDDSGDVQFPLVPPGSYVLQVSPGWIPVRWELTTPLVVEVQVAPGSATRAPAIGLAPIQKPLKRTFHGES